jgi:hypothetical protein
VGQVRRRVKKRAFVFEALRTRRNLWIQDITELKNGLTRTQDTIGVEPEDQRVMSSAKTSLPVLGRMD